MLSIHQDIVSYLYLQISGISDGKGPPRLPSGQMNSPQNRTMHRYGPPDCGEDRPKQCLSRTRQSGGGRNTD